MKKYDAYIGPELFHREMGIHTWQDDRGGKTAHGITQETADYVGVNIDDIDRDKAIEIYQQVFYDEPDFDKLDLKLAWRCTLDGLHSSPARITRRLQRTINLTIDDDLSVDGALGPMTLAGVKNTLRYIRGEIQERHAATGSHKSFDDLAIDDLCAQMKADQYAHYKKLCTQDPTQKKWWRGWLNRIRFEPYWYAQ